MLATTKIAGQSLMLDGGLLLIPQLLVISTDNGLSSVPSMRKE
jgi:hypothetical protein